jgi:hypothetical protein
MQVSCAWHLVHGVSTLYWVDCALRYGISRYGQRCHGSAQEGRYRIEMASPAAPASCGHFSIMVSNPSSLDVGTISDDLASRRLTLRHGEVIPGKYVTAKSIVRHPCIGRRLERGIRLVLEPGSPFTNLQAVLASVEEGDGCTKGC